MKYGKQTYVAIEIIAFGHGHQESVERNSLCGT